MLCFQMAFWIQDHPPHGGPGCSSWLLTGPQIASPIGYPSQIWSHGVRMNASHEKDWRVSQNNQPRGAIELVDALSVDVEDYFHVEAFASEIPISTWSQFPLRVRENTLRVLDL